MPENRILLIEDEATTRDLLSHVLMSAGYAVDVAATASIAGARLDSTTYALVLADWRLPDGDGIELADRAAEAGARTAILSGYLFHLPKGTAKRHHLLMKPMRPDEIIAVVRAVIGEPAGRRA